jgi:hypothetical protein
MQGGKTVRRLRLHVFVCTRQAWTFNRSPGCTTPCGPALCWPRTQSKRDPLSLRSSVQLALMLNCRSLSRPSRLVGRRDAQLRPVAAPHERKTDHGITIDRTRTL